MSAICFNLDQSKILSSGNGLTLYQMFTSIQIQSICKFKKGMCSKIEINFVFGRTENIVGKGEKAGYQHILLLPICFQKGFSFSRLLTLSVGKG